jgi:hypothetical protein
VTQSLCHIQIDVILLKENDMNSKTIQPHNIKAAATWRYGSGLVSCINVPRVSDIRQTIEMAQTVKPVDDSARELLHGLAIPVVFEGAFSAVASGGHTVDFTVNSALTGRAMIDLDNHKR